MAKEESSNNNAIYVLALVAIVAIVALVLSMQDSTPATPVVVSDGYVDSYDIVDEEGNLVGEALKPKKTSASKPIVIR